MLNVEAVALDELGIYFAGKKIDSDTIPLSVETVRYIGNNGGGINLGMSVFTDGVMSIISTSPGNQPYPALTGLCDTVLIDKKKFCKN